MEAANGPEAREPTGPADARRTGEAAAFRRAPDAQASSEESSTALVPAGLHDLAAPISMAAIRAALGQPDGRDGARAARDDAAAPGEGSTGANATGYFTGKVAASPTAPNRGVPQHPLAVGPLSGPLSGPVSAQGAAPSEPSLFGPWRGEGRAARAQAAQNQAAQAAATQNPAVQDSAAPDQAEQPRQKRRLRRGTPTGVPAQGTQTPSGAQAPAEQSALPMPALPMPALPMPDPASAAGAAAAVQAAGRQISQQPQMPPQGAPRQPHQRFGPGQPYPAPQPAPQSMQQPYSGAVQSAGAPNPQTMPQNLQQPFGGPQRFDAPRADQNQRTQPVPLPQPHESARSFDGAQPLDGAAGYPATRPIDPARLPQPFPPAPPQARFAQSGTAPTGMTQAGTAQPGAPQAASTAPLVQPAPPSAQRSGGRIGGMTPAMFADGGVIDATTVLGASDPRPRPLAPSAPVERAPGAALAPIPPARNLPAERRLPARTGPGSDVARRSAAAPAAPEGAPEGARESGPRHDGGRGKAPRLGITIGVCVALASIAAYALVQLGGGDTAPPLGTAGLPSYAIAVAGGAAASGAASVEASASASAAASASPSAGAVASTSVSADASPSTPSTPATAAAPAQTTTLVQPGDPPYSVGQSGPGITSIQQQLVQYRLLSLSNGVYSVTHSTTQALHSLGQQGSPQPDPSGTYGTATDDAIKAFEVDYLHEHDPPGSGCSVATYNALFKN